MAPWGRGWTREFMSPLPFSLSLKKAIFWTYNVIIYSLIQRWIYSTATDQHFPSRCMLVLSCFLAHPPNLSLKCIAGIRAEARTDIETDRVVDGSNNSAPA